MKRGLLLALTLVPALITTLAGQSVGDSEPEVRSKLGSPSMSRDTGERQIWMYDDGTKVVFVRGAVVEVNTPNNHPADYTTGEYVEPERPPQSPSANPAREARRRRAGDESISTPAALLIGGGGLVILVCQILFVVAAFSESVLWGLGVLFIPLMPLVFSIKNWEVVKKPILVSFLVGLPMIVAGVVAEG